MNAALAARDRNTTRRAAVSCQFGGSVTTALTGTKFAPVEMVNRLPAVLLRFSVGEIAQASGATKEAAKSWRAGTRCPHSPHLLNMGHNLERVRKFIHGEIDPPCAPMRTSEIVASFFANLNQLSHEPGKEGAEARAVLAAFTGRI